MANHWTTRNHVAAMGFKRLSVIAGTTGTVFCAAAVIGFTIDRPVWLSEHTALAGEVQENTLYRHEQRAFYIEERIWRLEQRLKKLKGDAPVEDHRRLGQLKKQLETAESRLKRVRGY